MKALVALALVLAASTAHAEVDMLLLGHSWHFGAEQPMNGNNPGAGLEYRSPQNWFVGALAYRDSYRRNAYSAYVGYEYDVPIAGYWTGFVALRAGYLNGSGFHGAMLLPTFGVAYRRVALEVLVLPKINANTTTMVGVFARIRF